MVGEGGARLFGRVGSGRIVGIALAVLAVFLFVQQLRLSRALDTAVERMRCAVEAARYGEKSSQFLVYTMAYAGSMVDQETAQKAWLDLDSNYSLDAEYVSEVAGYRDYLEQRKDSAQEILDSLRWEWRDACEGVVGHDLLNRDFARPFGGFEWP